MGFSRWEYWSGLPLPSPGDHGDTLGSNPVSCVSCIDRRILYHWATWEAPRVSGLFLFVLTRIPFGGYTQYVYLFTSSETFGLFLGLGNHEQSCSKYLHRVFVCVWTYIFLSCEITGSSGLCLTWWAIAKLFSSMTRLFYTLSSKVWEFQSLQYSWQHLVWLVSSCFAHFNEWSVVSRGGSSSHLL